MKRALLLFLLTTLSETSCMSSMRALANRCSYALNALKQRSYAMQTINSKQLLARMPSWRTATKLGLYGSFGLALGINATKQRSLCAEENGVRPWAKDHLQRVLAHIYDIDYETVCRVLCYPGASEQLAEAFANYIESPMYRGEFDLHLVLKVLLSSKKAAEILTPCLIKKYHITAAIIDEIAHVSLNVVKNLKLYSQSHLLIKLQAMLNNEKTYTTAKDFIMRTMHDKTFSDWDLLRLAKHCPDLGFCMLQEAKKNHLPYEKILAIKEGHAEGMPDHQKFKPVEKVDQSSIIIKRADSFTGTELQKAFESAEDMLIYGLHQRDREKSALNTNTFDLRRDFFPHEWVYFIMHQNEVVGVCIFGNCRLLHVAIHQRFQRKGLGSLLLKHIIDDAQQAGCSVIDVHSFEDNFYKKNGFKGHKEYLYLPLQKTEAS